MAGSTAGWAIRSRWSSSSRARSWATPWSRGWILPLLHDPDGHEVRFYTVEHHSDPLKPGVTTIHDPRETSERREREQRAAGSPAQPAGS
jgi:hypothetical protein